MMTKYGIFIHCLVDLISFFIIASRGPLNKLTLESFSNDYDDGEDDAL